MPDAPKIISEEENQRFLTVINFHADMLLNNVFICFMLITSYGSKYLVTPKR